jgi:hypothetical protein
MNRDVLQELYDKARNPLDIKHFQLSEPEVTTNVMKSKFSVTVPTGTLVFNLIVGKLSAERYEAVPHALLCKTLTDAICPLAFFEDRIAIFRNPDGRIEAFLELVMFNENENEAVISIQMTDNLWNRVAFEKAEKDVALKNLLSTAFKKPTIETKTVDVVCYGVKVCDTEVEGLIQEGWQFVCSVFALSGTGKFSLTRLYFKREKMETD